MNGHLDAPLYRSGEGGARRAVILVHGRGASAQNMGFLAEALSAKDTLFLFPEAYGRTWYPHSFLAPLDANEPWLSSGLEAIGRAVNAAADEGIPASATLIAGFSQGACLSLEYAARNPMDIAAVAALSGGLIGSGQLNEAEPPSDKTFDYAANHSHMSIFLGCSDVDFHIPEVRVRTSGDVFSALGAQVDLRIYPNAPHDINDDEVAALRSMVERLSA